MPSDPSTTADPARTLALLWGDRHRSARKGKHDLSVARIVDAGIAIADTSGLEALSMRRVAERLGVGTMSLYTYVPGKTELIVVMADTVYAAIPTAAAPQGGWRDRLVSVAQASFDAHHRHPWLLWVPTSDTLLGPGAAAKYDTELSTIDGIGLSDVEMDGVVSLVNGHVMSSARRAGEQAPHGDDTHASRWWQAHAPLLAGIADYSRFPVAARVGAAAGSSHGAAYPADGGFSFGMRRICDGVAALVEQRGDR